MKSMETCFTQKLKIALPQTMWSSLNIILLICIYIYTYIHIYIYIYQYIWNGIYIYTYIYTYISYLNYIPWFPHHVLLIFHPPFSIVAPQPPQQMQHLLPVSTLSPGAHGGIETHHLRAANRQVIGPGCFLGPIIDIYVYIYMCIYIICMYKCIYI